MGREHSLPRRLPTEGGDTPSPHATPLEAYRLYDPRAFHARTPTFKLLPTPVSFRQERLFNAISSTFLLL